MVMAVSADRRQAPHVQRVGVATLQNPFGFLEARSES